MAESGGRDALPGQGLPEKKWLRRGGWDRGSVRTKGFEAASVYTPDDQCRLIQGDGLREEAKARVAGSFRRAC